VHRMAEGRDTDTGKSRLYDGDLYSDFDVDGHELNEDLSNTPALAEAVRTSQLSRRPSTSTISLAPSTRHTAVRPMKVCDGHSGPPLTATQRAGYSSTGGHV